MTDKRPDLGAYGRGGRKAVPTVPTVPTDRDPVDPIPPKPHTTVARGAVQPSAAAAAAAREADATVQMNVRISPAVRTRIDELKAAHPFGRRATVRDVLEDAINAAYAAQIGGDAVT